MRLWLKRETFELDLLSVLSYDTPKTPLEIMEELDALWVKRGEQLWFLFWIWTPNASISRIYNVLSRLEKKGWAYSRERQLSAAQLTQPGDRSPHEWELTRRGVGRRIELEVEEEMRRTRTHYRPSHA